MGEPAPLPIEIVRIGIVGIGGRMGREIVAVAARDPAVAVVGGTVRRERPGLPDGIAIHTELAPLLAAHRAAHRPGIDVLIDFSTPDATMEAATQAADSGVPLVIGTTGLTNDQLALLRATSSRVAIHYARNMSHGVGMLQRLLPEIARALAGYDVEVIEAHHRHKTDAPSGTALALTDAILAGLAGDGQAHPLVLGREGHAPRQPGEIGIHALRGGGNSGEHQVIFASDEEEIRISHRAFNRGVFAAGAIRAAKALVGRPPGWYGSG